MRRGAAVMAMMVSATRHRMLSCRTLALLQPSHRSMAATSVLARPLKTPLPSSTALSGLEQMAN